MGGQTTTGRPARAACSANSTAASTTGSSCPVEPPFSFLSGWWLFFSSFPPDGFSFYAAESCDAVLCALPLTEDHPCSTAARFGRRGPEPGWPVLDVRRLRGRRVSVEMGHPDWPHHRFLNAPDMNAAVAWSTLRRDGAVWRRGRGGTDSNNRHLAREHNTAT